MEEFDEYSEYSNVVWDTRADELAEEENNNVTTTTTIETTTVTTEFGEPMSNSIDERMFSVSSHTFSTLYIYKILLCYGVKVKLYYHHM